jgi:periplasmic divalent cation tolerance protein
MRLVLCTVPPDRAHAIARDIVSGGYAVCVAAAPVTSTYKWKGELSITEEVQLLIKVAASKVAALKQAMIEMHPYEVPEFVVLPVDAEASLAAYVKWVREEA